MKSLDVDFLGVNSEFEREFKTKLDSRYFTFKAALNLITFEEIPVSILETGCVRMENDYGAGNSTYLFAYYLQNYAEPDSLLTSVDISKENLNICKSLIYPHFPPDFNRFHFQTIEDDSINYLKSEVEGNSKHELIYLDSLDANLENFPICVAAQNHQLSEAELAVQLFSDKLPFKVLLLDDNNLPWGGKTSRTKEFLHNQEWTCVLDFQQSLWIKANN